jgi:hypothetical protein
VLQQCAKRPPLNRGGGSLAALLEMTVFTEVEAVRRKPTAEPGLPLCGALTTLPTSKGGPLERVALR